MLSSICTGPRPAPAHSTKAITFLVFHLWRLNLGRRISSQMRGEAEWGGQLSGDQPPLQSASQASSFYPHIPQQGRSPFYRWGNCCAASKQQGPHLKPGWSSSNASLLSSSSELSACFWNRGSALLAKLKTNKKRGLCAFLLSSLKWTNWKYHKPLQSEVKIRWYQEQIQKGPWMHTVLKNLLISKYLFLSQMTRRLTSRLWRTKTKTKPTKHVA